MSIPEFCIPNPSTFLGNLDYAGCNGDWCFINNAPISFNSLYSTIYSLGIYTPFLLEGIPDIVQNDLSSWSFKITIIESLPYIITFVLLFIVLMVSNVLSYELGIILIILLLLLFTVCIIWIAQETSNVVNSLDTQVRAQIAANWDLYKVPIAVNLVESVFEPHTRQSYTSAGSTGFNDNSEIISLKEKYHQLGGSDHLFC
jgi:hypothetical protein